MPPEELNPFEKDSFFFVGAGLGGWGGGEKE